MSTVYRLELVVYRIEKDGEDETVKDVPFEEVVFEAPTIKEVNIALEELKWLWNK